MTGLGAAFFAGLFVCTQWRPRVSTALLLCDSARAKEHRRALMVLAMSRWRQRAWMRVLALFWHATMLAASWEGLITGVAFLDAGMMSSAVGPVAHRAKVATKQRSTNTHTSTKIRQIAGMDLGARGHRLLTTRTQSGSSRRRVNTGSGHNGARTRGSGARHCRRPATRGLSPLAVRLPRLGRCGAEARRGASARTDRQGNRAGTDTQAQHLLPPTLPSVGRRWRAPAIRRPFWLGPTQPRWECAHPRGWSRRAMGIAMFSRHRHARATARGTVFPHRPLAFPALVPALTLSCPVGLVGSATQITRSLETRTESPRLPLSLQQCHSASHRFPLA